MDPGARAQLDAASADLALKRAATRRRKRIGLLAGGLIAFAVGGLPGLAAACLFVAIVRFVTTSR
jgi:hypothetical protein